MIKLFSLKQQKKDEIPGRSNTQKKASAAQLRITKGNSKTNLLFSILSEFLFHSDVNELNLPKTCQMEFPDPDDLLNFKLIICPDEVSNCSTNIYLSIISHLLISSHPSP